MKEIQEIQLTRFNNGAHYIYVNLILSRAKGDNVIMAKAGALVDAFEQAVRKEDEALLISRKNMHTDHIAEADNERDEAYIIYKKVVKAWLDHPTPAKAEAAKMLYQNLKDYRISPKMQLSRETGLLVNLIQDLEGKHAAHVATLELTETVARLKEANERVQAYTLDRTNDRMAIEVGALKSARSDSDDAYRALVKRVNALAEVFGEDDYADFIDYVNTEIVQYKRQVLKQTTKAPSTSGSGSGSDSGSAEIYTVTLSVSNSAHGTVSGGGQYEAGQSVSLHATAKTGYRFVRWSDGVTTASRRITITGNVSLTAIFEAATTGGDTGDNELS